MKLRWLITPTYRPGAQPHAVDEATGDIVEWQVLQLGLEVQATAVLHRGFSSFWQWTDVPCVLDSH